MKERLKDYIVEVAYSEPNFPLIENLAKIEECIYFDSTSGYLRDGIGKFDQISETKLKKSLLEAKIKTYQMATKQGRKNLEYLERIRKKLFKINEIDKTIKVKESSEKGKIWFLAKVPENFSCSSLKEEEWINEIYLLGNSEPFNIYIRCECGDSFDLLSNKLSRLCGEPLEREFVLVFATFENPRKCPRRDLNPQPTA